MAAKWIKITTDMFDNRKIKHLRKLPEGDSIVLIWVMLLTIAGKCNDNGRIFLTESIPYTTKMLADELDFEEETVQTALQALERFDMIEMDNGYYTISGWGEHQNAEGMEKIREQSRMRKQKQREKEKLLEDSRQETVNEVEIPDNSQKNAAENEEMSCENPEVSCDDSAVSCDSNTMSRTMSRDSHVTVAQCHATERDKEKDIDIKEKEKKEKATCQQVVDLFHSICVSYPAVRTLSESRKKAIRARLRVYTLDDFKLLFEKAEASSFLNGSNNRNWTANFDWLLKESNMVKVLEGNYDNKPGKEGRMPAGGNKFNNFTQRQYDYGALEEMLLQKT